MTITRVTFNINHYVRFRLTEEGKARILKFHREQFESYNLPPYSWFDFHKPDAEGFYSEQLWHVMEIFGPAMHVGAGPFFLGNDLEFVLDDLP